MALGTSGYPEDGAGLGLPEEAPCYLWHFGPAANDHGLYRHVAEYRDGAWRLPERVHGLALAEFARQYPGQQYYAANEPTYLPNPPTAREMAEVTLALQEAVSGNGLVHTPGFAQTELGESWWGDIRYATGPDGRPYVYAEAYVRWLHSLGGRPPDAISWHAYPRTRDGQRVVDGKTAVEQVRAVFQAVRRLHERWWPSAVPLLLTETGWIDWACAGSARNAGWLGGQGYMTELIEAHVRGLADVVCWFIPRSEACAPGRVGGWPGYLIYSDCDPDGTAGGGESCEPWYFGALRCHIAVGQGEGLTPLGELWRQGAQRKMLSHKLLLPVVRGGD